MSVSTQPVVIEIFAGSSGGGAERPWWALTEDVLGMGDTPWNAVAHAVTAWWRRARDCPPLPGCAEVMLRHVCDFCAVDVKRFLRIRVPAIFPPPPLPPGWTTSWLGDDPSKDRHLCSGCSGESK